jgi:hypothetical protein
MDEVTRQAVICSSPRLAATPERVTAGMRAAQARGRHLGRPATPQRVVREIEALAKSTDLSIRQIQKKIAGRAR